MGQDQESVKLDISQTIVESCAPDEEGNIYREGGQSMNVSRRWVSPTELGRHRTEKKRESECWAMIKRV